MAGQEGVPSVISPMARTYNDLRYFVTEYIRFKPWRYDGAVHPIEWRDDVVKDVEARKLRVAVMWDDGTISGLFLFLFPP